MAMTRYLLANHRITANLALAALERYAASRRPIGRVALQEGLLKPGPLLHVLDEQLAEDSLGDRRRFSEVAVALGYLDVGQVRTLLARQAELSPTFEQVLVDLGVFQEGTAWVHDFFFPGDQP